MSGQGNNLRMNQCFFLGGLLNTNWREWLLQKVGSIISFEGGQGYVALDGVNIENFVQVNFKFKTKEEDGLIFYMANEDQSHHVSLSMLNGALVMRTVPGGEVSSKAARKLNDGMWHVVTATANGTQIRLDIDDFEEYTEPTPNSQLVIPATPIYFAGVPASFNLAEGAAAAGNSFTGCIGDTTINGRLINYASSTETQGASITKCSDDADQIEEPVRNPIRIEDDSSPTSPDPEPSPEYTEPPPPALTTVKPTTVASNNNSYCQLQIAN